MSESVFLAFDFGTRRIGVAIANSVTRAARPLAVVDSEGETRWRAIAALLAEWKPQQLLVGRPTQADGTEDEMTARAERFARQLHGRFRLPVSRVDERFSSSVVEHGADDAAAAVILQQWLDQDHAAGAEHSSPSKGEGGDPSRREK